MKLLLILPILIPAFTGGLSFLSGYNVSLKRIITLIGSFILFIASILLLIFVIQDGIQVVQIGNWPAPYGITLVADIFSAIMVFISCYVNLSVVIYSLALTDKMRERFGFYTLTNTMMMGVCGAFLTGDIFNLYVWFEVMLISSFVLMALGGEKLQMEGAFKYVTLNLISSSLFLIAVGIFYGEIGTLNMADIAQKITGDHISIYLVTMSSLIFLIAFGIKAGIFPLFFWLPASYHTPPIAATAIFSGLLTKVGIYTIIRVFTLMFPQDIKLTHTVILLLAGFTMVTGVLGAVVQFDLRRLLSFHIISQIGYIILGLAFYTPFALAASIYYLVHNILAKTNLFLVSGIAYRLKGTYDLKRLGSLYLEAPWLALIFLISALSLAGFPPLSGFFAKLTIIQSGFLTEHYFVVGVSLWVSLITLFSMTKIWQEAFWKKAHHDTAFLKFKEEEEPAIEKLWPLYTPAIIMAGLTVLMGIFAEPCFEIAIQAGKQLFTRTEYIEAVLGKTSVIPN